MKKVDGKRGVTFVTTKDNKNHDIVCFRSCVSLHRNVLIKDILLFMNYLKLNSHTM